MVFLLGGVVFAGLPIQNELQRNQVVASAEPVDATVLSTNVTHRVGGGIDRNDEADPYYSVTVRYRYTVDGTTYDGSNVTPPGATDSGTDLRKPTRSAAESFVDDYEVNSTVTAYHLPDDPSTSFLVKRTTPMVQLAIPAAFGLFFGVPGAVLLGLGLGVLDLGFLRR